MGEFTGTLNDAKTEAEAKWTQAGTLPLILKRTEKVSELKRSQMPRLPFLYQEIEVAYPNQTAKGVNLSGI